MNRASPFLKTPATILATKWSSAAYLNFFGTNLKNRLINGDMRIDQRNEGASAVAGAGLISSVDKWKGGTGGGGAGRLTFQRLTATPPAGFTHYLRITTATADAAPAATSEYQLYTGIEAYLLEDFGFGAAGAQAISISFRVRSSLTGQFSGALMNYAATRSYAFIFTIAAANTWTTINLTIPGDVAGAWVMNSNAGGAFLQFNLGSGVNFVQTPGAWTAFNTTGATGDVKLISTLAATLDFTGIQLEVSPAVTNFDYLTIGSQLMLCQRYYQKSFIQGTKPVQNAGIGTGEQYFIAGKAAVLANSGFVTFPVVMRATGAAVTLFNPSGANAQITDITAGADCSASGETNIADRGMLLTCTGAAGTAIGNRLAGHWTADSDL